METIPSSTPAGRPAGIERAIIALCGLGLVFMAYLTHLHFKTSASSFCNFGAGFSCDLVNKSTYAEIFGVPVSALGLVYFAGVALLVWKKFDPAWLRIVQVWTALSLAFGLYLSYVEVFQLGSICVFCEASKLTMLAILLLSLRAGKKSSPPQP